MSYEPFYGFSERPFAITPDPRFFFESAQHSGALAKLIDSIDASKGLSVVIGEIGLGKTFISRKLVEHLQNNEEKFDASLFVIIHHEITVTWFLKAIAVHLGIENPPEQNSQIISLICQRLVQIDEEGKKAVLLMDEAHMLQEKGFYEELRGLLNVESENRKLFNVVLFGPPELDQLLALDPPLVMRIGLKVTLKPLNEQETAGYIAHRVGTAGCPREIFPADTSRVVYRYAQGVPRLINTICENALLEGFLDKVGVLTPQIIERAATDLGLHAPPEPKETAQEDSERRLKEEQQKKKKNRISYI